MQHQVFGAGADADLGSPDAQAGAYVILGVAAAVMPPGFLVHGIRHPGQRPNLAAVRVPAELEIDARLLRLFQMIRLVVQ